MFHERFQTALLNLSEIVSKVNQKAGESELNNIAVIGDFKMIDLFETLKKCDQILAGPIDHTGSIEAINASNLRGALTARALIVCQYCHAYELMRRETQQTLALNYQWHLEMQTL